MLVLLISLIGTALASTTIVNMTTLAPTSVNMTAMPTNATTLTPTAAPTLMTPPHESTNIALIVVGGVILLVLIVILLIGCCAGGRQAGFISARMEPADIERQMRTQQPLIGQQQQELSMGRTLRVDKGHWKE